MHVADVEADVEASGALRRAMRVERLGGREPLPPLVASAEGGARTQGLRFSHAFELVPGEGATGLACRRCGCIICDAAANVYEHAVVRTVPVAGRAPFGLVYPGSEAFVLHHCYCPGCGLQFDVQIGRRDEPVLRAAEPVLGPVASDG